jgi:hypothetical protein
MEKNKVIRFRLHRKKKLSIRKPWYWKTGLAHFKKLTTFAFSCWPLRPLPFIIVYDRNEAKKVIGTKKKVFHFREKVACLWPGLRRAVYQTCTGNIPTLVLNPDENSGLFKYWFFKYIHHLFEIEVLAFLVRYV